MELINKFFEELEVMDEARTAALGTYEDYDAPIYPFCMNRETGFTKQFTTIRQAAEWVKDDGEEDGLVPQPFGSVKPSKWSSYSWSAIPKPTQNLIMNNILNSACKKENRKDLEDRFRDGGYGLVWDLKNPEDLISEDWLQTYEEGHGSSREEARAKVIKTKEEKAAKEKQDMINFVLKNKDWAINVLKRYKSHGVSLFDKSSCEDKFGYPAYGIYGYFSDGFDKSISSIQKDLDNNSAARGKKAKSLVKYFDYLSKVTSDVGLDIDDTGFLKESLINNFFKKMLNESEIKNHMENRIEEIISEAACPEEVWTRVEEEFEDAGIAYLMNIDYPQE